MALHWTFALLCFCGAAVASRVHVAGSDDGLWVRKSGASLQEYISITIALASPEPEAAVQALLSVSDPSSHQYGRHWRKQDVHNTFSPSPNAVRQVHSWVIRSGVSAQQVHRTGGLLHARGSVSQIQALLQAELFNYEHQVTGSQKRGFEHFEIPSELKESVLWITPTPQSLDHTPQGSVAEPTWRSRSLDDCSSRVTPSCLRTVYNISSDNFSHPNNTFGFFLPGWSTWLSSDLDSFFETHEPQLVGHRPSVVSINDGYRQTDVQIGPYNLEPNMDAEYTMALSSPQPVTNYQVGDSEHPGNLNTMLAAFDGTYCDSLNEDIDPIVADFDCGTIEAPNVLSISYVWGEDSFPPEYLAYQCHEFLKLGLQGVTVVVSTGDTGPARHPDGACDDGNTFVPSWPASCPWVTAVGGTSFAKREKTVTSWRNLPSSGSPEEYDIPDEVVYARPHDNRTSSSGGGFSGAFASPQYQVEHVRRYLTSEAAHLNDFKDLFNASGRGYPDVAAAASLVEVATGGRFRSVSGTSSSAPIFAAMVARINSRRLRAGKSPVGFINPVLYANTQAFQDVVDGHNSGCGVASAFQASEGWDAVTGLGSPDYGKLLDVFMQLE